MYPDAGSPRFSSLPEILENSTMGLCLERDFKGTHEKLLENMTI